MDQSHSSKGWPQARKHKLHPRRTLSKPVRSKIRSNHCGCLRNLINRQPPTYSKCIYIFKKHSVNSGKNDKLKFWFFSTISTASSEMQMLEVVDDDNMMFRWFRILKLLTNFLLDIFGNAISSHIYVYRLYVLLAASFFCIILAKQLSHPQLHPKWLWQYHPSRESPRGLMTGLYTWHNNFSVSQNLAGVV